jgi:pyruvate formate lyase activating enzyme
MTSIERTPPSTLRGARETARRHGLRYVYVGNVHDDEGQTT